jgi:hypothetical protein
MSHVFPVCVALKVIKLIHNNKITFDLLVPLLKYLKHVEFLSSEFHYHVEFLSCLNETVFIFVLKWPNKKQRQKGEF